MCQSFFSQYNFNRKCHAAVIRFLLLFAGVSHSTKARMKEMKSISSSEAFLGLPWRVLYVYPPRKLTWHWKIIIFNGKYIFKWLVFHCHISFPGCNPGKVCWYSTEVSYRCLTKHRSKLWFFVKSSLHSSSETCYTVQLLPTPPRHPYLPHPIHFQLYPHAF